MSISNLLEFQYVLTSTSKKIGSNVLEITVLPNLNNLNMKLC